MQAGGLGCLDKEPTEALGQGLCRLARQLSKGARRLLCQKNVNPVPCSMSQVLEDGDRIMIWQANWGYWGFQVRKDT